MSIKRNKNQEGRSAKDRAVLTHRAAIAFSVTMLVVGFLAGVVFGVMKTGSMPSGSLNDAPVVAGNPPPWMFQALEAEAARNPQDAEAWVRMGNAYFDADQHQKAIDAYEKSLAIAPDTPNVLTDLGVMYRRNKQPEKAVEMFSRAMSADPKHEASRMNKGIVLLYDLKEETAAVEAWESLLALNPLATFGDGQSVDELVRHYKEDHEEEGGRDK